MSPVLTTDNIDRLRSRKLDAPRGWEISFRSGNEALHHQLYVNGKLTAWTDTISQRSFELDAESSPLEIVIAAVDRENRTIDLSDQLPSSLLQQPWIYRASVVYSPKYRRGARIAVLGDHGTGQIDLTPLDMRDARPEWLTQWGFGEGPFGDGGLGFDAASAPGLGKAPFGAGGFGIETEIMFLSAPLLEEDTHQVLVRLISENGEHEDSSIQNVPSCPPPPPPTHFEATNYNATTKTLTLQIQGGST
jgi:hypothetical protein